MHQTKCLQSMVVAALTLILPQLTIGLVIQAEIDFDDNSEHLIDALISQVDAIVDPNKVDAVNATKELAYALLKIGPLLTITGNISERTEIFSLRFSLNAKAEINKVLEFNAISIREDLEENEESHIESFIVLIESYMLSVLRLIGHAILTNIVANLMSDLALHSDTNLVL